jgi:hypothetical protein
MATPEASELARIQTKRDAARQNVETWLEGIQEQRGVGCDLTIAETEKFRHMTRDLRALTSIGYNSSILTGGST